jgi:hypothetical protein
VLPPQHERRIFRRLALVTLVACASVARARAEQPQAVREARRWFKTGVEEVHRARWAEALPAFTVSYRLRPHVVTRLNIAACHRALGHYAEARSWYAQVLADEGAVKLPHLLREARARDRELADLASAAPAAHRP